MARAAPNQVLPSLPCPPFAPASTLSSPHPLPLLVTGSGVTVWNAGIGLAFWSVHLCQLPPGSIQSPPFLSYCWDPCTSLPSSPTGTLLGGEGKGREGRRGERRGGTGLGAAEVEKLVWKSSRMLFISRMLPSASVTPGIYSGCRS